MGGGKIINIGSMFAIFGAAYAVPYAASKGGLVQMTKSLAAAWAGDNIQVNAVLPGWIDTELTRDARRRSPGCTSGCLARTPAGRWGVPEDLAGVAVFLASCRVRFRDRRRDPGRWRVLGLGLTVQASRNAIRPLSEAARRSWQRVPFRTTASKSRDASVSLYLRGSAYWARGASARGILPRLSVRAFIDPRPRERGDRMTPGSLAGAGGYRGFMAPGQRPHEINK